MGTRAFSTGWSLCQSASPNEMHTKLVYAWTWSWKWTNMCSALCQFHSEKHTWRLEGNWEATRWKSLEVIETTSTALNQVVPFEDLVNKCSRRRLILQCAHVTQQFKSAPVFPALSRDPGATASQIEKLSSVSSISWQKNTSKKPIENPCHHCNFPPSISSLETIYWLFKGIGRWCGNWALILTVSNVLSSFNLQLMDVPIQKHVMCTQWSPDSTTSSSRYIWKKPKPIILCNSDSIQYTSIPIWLAKNQAPLGSETYATFQSTPWLKQYLSDPVATPCVE